MPSKTQQENKTSAQQVGVKSQKKDDKKSSAFKIIADPKKSPEKYIKEAEKKYIIPKLVREEFTDLIKLMFETESMDQEEREYWLQIMPIMNEEQIKKFRDILVNEKEQLASLDKKGNAGKSITGVSTMDEAEMQKRFKEIKKAEDKSKIKEKKKGEKLLQKLENL